MSIDINFEKVDLSKTAVLRIGEGKGFLASLAGELKKLAADSKPLTNKCDGKKRDSANKPEVAEAGKKGELAEGQALIVQATPNYAAPLSIVPALHGKGESDEHHSEELVSGLAVKTEVEPRLPTTPGAVAETNPAREGETIAGKVQVVDTVKLESGEATLRESEVESKSSAKVSPEQERFRKVVDDMESAGVQFDYLRSKVEGKPELHELRAVNARSDGRNKTIVSEPLSERSAVTEVTELFPGTGQSVSNERPSEARNEIREYQLSKAVEPGGFSEVRSNAAAFVPFHLGSSGESQADSGVQATAPVADVPLSEGSTKESRPTRPSVEVAVGEINVRERLATGATGANVLNTRSVPRTHKGTRDEESQHRTPTLATHRDLRNEGAVSSDWRERCPENGVQQTVSAEQQRDQTQSVLKEDVAPRPVLHQSSMTGGMPADQMSTGRRTDSGENRLRDGAQPGVVAPATTLHGAHLFAQKEHAEMHIGLHTAESGRVEVHTVLRAGQTETIIAVENGSVRDALLAEVPGMNSSTREQHVDIGKLTVVETGTMASFGNRNSGGDNGEWREQRLNTATMPFGGERAERSNELEQITTDGLSIHV